MTRIRKSVRFLYPSKDKMREVSIPNIDLDIKIDKNYLVKAEPILARPVEAPSEREGNLLYDAWRQSSRTSSPGVSCDVFISEIFHLNLRPSLEIHWVFFTLALKAWAVISGREDAIPAIIRDLLEYGSRYASLVKDYKKWKYLSTFSEFMVPLPDDGVDFDYVGIMNTYDDIIPHDILPFYVEEEEDPTKEWISEPAPHDEEITALFTTWTERYLAKYKLKTFDFPSEADIRLKVTGSMMYDDLKDRTATQDSILSRQEFILSLANTERFKYRSFNLQVRPGEQRCPWMQNEVSFVSNYIFETLIQQIIREDPLNMYGHDFDVRTFRFRHRYRGLTDFKKAGITFPLWILTTICECLSNAYPSLKETFDPVVFANNHCSGTVQMKSGRVVPIQERGFGLGNMNALMTMAQLIVSFGLGIRGYCLNDDNVWDIESYDDWESVNDSLSDLGFIISKTKVALIDTRRDPDNPQEAFVFCEEYLPTEFHRKGGYYAAHLMKQIAGYNISHVKEKFAAILQDVGYGEIDGVRRYVLAHVQRLWGDEFYPGEDSTPYSLGGWSPCKGELGEDLSFRWIDSQEDIFRTWVCFRINALPRTPGTRTSIKPKFDPWNIFEDIPAYTNMWRSIHNKVYGPLGIGVDHIIDLLEAKSHERLFNHANHNLQKVMWDVLERRRQSLYKKWYKEVKVAPNSNFDAIKLIYIRMELATQGWFAYPRSIFEDGSVKTKDVSIHVNDYFIVKLKEPVCSGTKFIVQSTVLKTKELATSLAEGSDGLLEAIKYLVPEGIVSRKPLRFPVKEPDFPAQLFKFGLYGGLQWIEYTTASSGGNTVLRKDFRTRTAKSVLDLLSIDCLVTPEEEPEEEDAISIASIDEEPMLSSFQSFMDRVSTAPTGDLVENLPRVEGTFLDEIEEAESSEEDPDEYRPPPPGYEDFSDGESSDQDYRDNPDYFSDSI